MVPTSWESGGRPPGGPCANLGGRPLGTRRRDSSGHLPAHFGYKKLAVIRTKQGDFEGAIRLCEKALAQGWGGDWEKRIARLRRRSGSLQL